MTTTVGTTYYMAPEVIKQDYSSLCDIWSAGIMLYVMFVGYPPFYSQDESKLFFNKIYRENCTENLKNESKV